MSVPVPSTLTRPNPDGRSALGAPAVCLATLLWASGGTIGKSADLSGLSVAMWRLWIAVAVLGIICIIRRERFDLVTVRRVAPAGLLFALNIAFFFSAVRATSIVNATIIGALTPVLVVPIAAVALGERLTRVTVTAGAGALLGVVIVVLGAGDGGARRSTEGDLLAVGSLLVWVVFFFVTKRIRATTAVGTLPLLTIKTATAAVVMTPVALLGASDAADVNPTRLGWLLALALLPGIGGHGLQVWAHRHVDIGVSSLLGLGEPVMAPLIAWMVLGEAVSAVQVAGILVVVVCLAVVTLRSSSG